MFEKKSEKKLKPFLKSFDIVAFLKQLTQRPGVYRMFNANGTIIYIGKAKNLKKRVSSYFKKTHGEIKTAAMVTQIAKVEVTVTDTESEAFILESTLIKRHKPKYNILFLDDKSYPYIYVSTDKPFPALSYHRGAKRRKGEYFGPFPNASAVHQTLQALQKIFKVRQCAESVFNHRSRPCLQYQIKRCSGPCVEGVVTSEAYREEVNHTLLFLEGKSFAVVDALAQKMDVASQALEFEIAAQYRDKISALRTIQSQDLINQPSVKDMDVIVMAEQANQVCVCLMMYRGGNLWGCEHFYPKILQQVDQVTVLNAFITQHYQVYPVPAGILLPIKLPDQIALEKWLKEKRGSQVRLKQPIQQNAKSLVSLAHTNALTGLKQHLTQKATQSDRINALQEVLALPAAPQQMECFDISHTQGQLTVASCVVFIDGIPNTQSYRKFNIEGITGGDDYAAMHQVLMRRYQRLKDQQSTGGRNFPSLIVIDGGKGQLNQAIEVLKNLELDHIPLVSVAKGEGRKAGLEILYTPHNMQGIDLKSDHIALHLINYIRDEAHRFAITSHRAKRTKAQTHSSLENIDGIGPKTRKNLLVHFGGLNQVKQASVSELTKVKGISRHKAQMIYDFFHGAV
ncbi:Excinuclease ABC subunit C [hydrothermal vent metagenome]|uniref:Excinuclease ABC subunit C n=1 Tax=hydrothermal vent metagenome TaxID=652676 RepID=A0A3B0W695_9ZZZZ